MQIACWQCVVVFFHLLLWGMFHDLFLSAWAVPCWMYAMIYSFFPRFHCILSLRFYCNIIVSTSDKCQQFFFFIFPFSCSQWKCAWKPMDGGKKKEILFMFHSFKVTFPALCFFLFTFHTFITSSCVICIPYPPGLTMTVLKKDKASVC